MYRLHAISSPLPSKEWSMSMKKTGKTAYTCKVERSVTIHIVFSCGVSSPLSAQCRPEQASYLYFMSFAISVLEHHVEKVEVFVSQ